MDNVKAYFDRAAAGYEERSAGWHWRWLRDREFQAVRRMAGEGPLGDVLELGAGTGYYSRRLSEQGCRSLTCVDVSARMLDRCAIPACRRIVGDIQDFRLEERFDLIVCAGALEFVDSPEKVLNNAAAMLKREGAFVAVLPCRSWPGRAYQYYHRRHQIDVRLFSFDGMAAETRRAGMTLKARQIVPPFSWVMKAVPGPGSENKGPS
ncbi:MAG: class I SAM-dependent methyltransferase [Candidatus Omnitrophota bacterium]|nr:class I SAM-dependent methyltransferase [Candidatus Omnitrophota bacterium]MDZ4241971.1 class I SAM-dependent methyltransferase [Candidatus Omnitrophota bacterium]